MNDEHGNVMLASCQRPRAFDKYGKPTQLCGRPGAVYRPDRLVAYLCGSCARECP
ncbi:hypothetical protein [Nonomuraea salmonea]|uniref:4Fe-4S ferredoxin-type domain-containing protein n=1 Tax=Nonomuraea salmonea TaxID=46181 RepID=A0ABV5P2Y4_9ACTN